MPYFGSRPRSAEPPDRPVPVAALSFGYGVLLGCVLVLVRMHAGVLGQVVVSVLLLAVVTAAWLVIRIRRDPLWSARLLYLLVATACASVGALLTS